MGDSKLQKVSLVVFLVVSLHAGAAEIMLENLPNGRQQVIGYQGITERTQDPIDNCQSGKGVITAKGNLVLNGEFGVFPALVGKRQTEVGADLREFDNYHKRQFIKFIKKNQRYQINYQSCGNAAVIDLIDISLIK